MSYLSKEEYSLKRYFQEALLDYLSSPNIFSALNFNQISVKNLYALNDLNNPYYQNGLLIPSILTKILDVINLQSLNKNFNLILFSCIDILFFRDDEINEKFVFNGTNDNEYYNNEQLMLYNFKKDYIKTFVKYLNLVKYEEKNLFNELIIIIKKYKDISIIFNYYYYNLLCILENNEITNFYEIFLLLYILYKKYLYCKNELFNYFNKVKYYNPKIFPFFMDELNEIFSYIFNNNFINNSINNDNNLINSIRNDLQIKINLIKYLCINNPDHIDNTIDDYLKLLEDNNNNNNNNMINPNNANRFRNEEFINLVSNYFESNFILNDMETIINRENPYYIRNSYKYNNNNDHLNNAIRQNDNKKRHRKRYENFSLNYNINDKMNLLGIDNFEDEVREGYNLKIFMNNFDNLSLQDKKDCINSDLDFINEKINKAVKKNCDIETFNILNKYKNEIIAKAEEYLNKTYKRNTLNYKNLTYNPLNNNYNNNLNSYNNKTLKNRNRTLKTSMSDFGINNNNNNIVVDNNNENNFNDNNNNENDNKNVNDSNNNSLNFINNNIVNNSGIKTYNFNNSGNNSNIGGSIYLLNSFNKLNKSNNSIITNKSTTNKDNSNFNSSEKKKK